MPALNRTCDPAFIEYIPCMYHVYCITFEWLRRPLTTGKTLIDNDLFSASIAALTPVTNLLQPSVA